MLELVCGQSAGGSLKMAKNGADFAGNARGHAVLGTGPERGKSAGFSTADRACRSFARAVSSRSPASGLRRRSIGAAQPGCAGKTVRRSGRRNACAGVDRARGGGVVSVPAGHVPFAECRRPGERRVRAAAAAPRGRNAVCAAKPGRTFSGAVAYLPAAGTARGPGAAQGLGQFVERLLVAERTLAGDAERDAGGRAGEFLRQPAVGEPAPQKGFFGR